MAVAVVDLLEGIDVEHESGDAVTALTAAMEDLRRLALDGAAVEGAGESVGVGEFFKTVAKAGSRHPEEAEAEAGDDGPVEPDVQDVLLREPSYVEEADSVGGGVQAEEDAHDDGRGPCAVAEGSEEKRSATGGGGDGDDRDKGDAEIMVFRPEGVADGRDRHEDGEHEEIPPDAAAQANELGDCLGEQGELDKSEEVGENDVDEGRAVNSAVQQEADAATEVGRSEPVAAALTGPPDRAGKHGQTEEEQKTCFDEEEGENVH